MSKKDTEGEPCWSVVVAELVALLSDIELAYRPARDTTVSLPASLPLLLLFDSPASSSTSAFDRITSADSIPEIERASP